MTYQAPQPIEPTPWPPRQEVDLKALVRTLASSRAQGSATPAEHRRSAIFVESPTPRPIEAAPLVAAGYLDGIQRHAVVARHDHRDVTIAYIAAGTVRDTTLLNVDERLAVVCSVEDEDGVRSLLQDVPVVPVPDLLPWGVASATADWIDATRRRLEQSTLDNAPRVPDEFIVVDGTLPPDSARRDVVSVVKGALQTEWITDHTLLPAQGGWRSCALRLPATRSGDRSRLTCFVRLRDAEGCHPWGYSLIRVECFEDSGVEILDAAAALAVHQRQPLTSRDPRAEVHLRGMRRTEEVLHARAPFAIEVVR